MRALEHERGFQLQGAFQNRILDRFGVTDVGRHCYAGARRTACEIGKCMFLSLVDFPGEIAHLVRYRKGLLQEARCRVA